MRLPSLRVFYQSVRQTGHRLAQLLSLLVISGLMSPALAADDDKSINLRLFGKNVVGDYNGCHVAFWQKNKDPKTDKYSYIFYAPFNDGQELPGWMKIGKTVYEFERQDNGQAQGQRFEDLRLYRTSKGTYTVLFEVTDQHVANNNIVIDKAKLTLIQSKHYPFVISVKGGIICPQMEQSMSAAPDESAAPLSELYGDAIQLEAGIDFENLSAVPAGILNSIKRDAPDCEPSNTTGYGMRFAISDAMTLWEVPCNLYARTGSSVYVTALNSNPEYSNVLIFPAVPDHGDVMDFYEIRAPRVNAKNAIVTSEFYDGDGTCGSYQSYQLRAVEGEALEFFLLEYREKPTCDGVQGGAEQFPLVYSAQ